MTAQEGRGPLTLASTGRDSAVAGQSPRIEKYSDMWFAARRSYERARRFFYGPDGKPTENYARFVAERGAAS